MFKTTVAQARVAMAALLGRPIPVWALNELLAAAVATYEEFGGYSAGAREAVAGSTLDADARSTAASRCTSSIQRFTSTERWVP